MTSQIVSSSIDENFPIAGQDNDSQGFRDNFSIIKDGLATASSEITVLQNTTAKIDETNNFNGTLIENALTNQLYGKVFAITTAGTTVIDYRSGEYHVVTVAGNHSLRFQQFAGSDPEPVYAKIRLELSPSSAGPSGWNVTFTAPAGGSVTGTVGFPTPGENPVINIGDDADLKTIVDVWTTNGKDFYVGLIGSFSQEYDLASLTDVILTSPSQGQVLVYNNNTGKWANGTPSVSIGSIESLENVGDVTYEDLAIGDTLRWNGVNWTPATIAGLNDLSDVIINTLNTNHVLKYNGTNWINTTLMLGELGNVTTSSPVEGDILRYNADDGTWKNEKDPNIKFFNVKILNDPPDTNDSYQFDNQTIAPGLLTFNIGHIYRFDLSDPSNKRVNLSPPPTVNVPQWLRFSSGLNGLTAYNTDVRYSSALPGTPGSYVEIEITKDTPSPLYVWASDTTTGGTPTPQLLGDSVAIAVINKSFYTGSEDLANAAAASLVLSTSYFSTAAAETATLAPGVEGQIKTFAMFAATGDMVITVSNAGWKTSGSGTVTFDTIGQACTLQYINSKWFCVGNNGAVFA
jgi:hypothetical protein